MIDSPQPARRLMTQAKQTRFAPLKRHAHISYVRPPERRSKLATARTRRWGLATYTYVCGAGFGKKSRKWRDIVIRERNIDYLQRLGTGTCAGTDHGAVEPASCASWETNANRAVA